MEIPKILVTEERISTKAQKLLVAAGYIVVHVTDSSKVRLLSSEPSLLSSDVILQSALKAMVIQQKESYGSVASKEFVKFLAECAEKHALAKSTDVKGRDPVESRSGDGS